MGDEIIKGALIRYINVYTALQAIELYNNVFGVESHR